jgi:LAO/AO transport system kinase
MEERMETLIREMKNGDQRSLARLISCVEDRQAGWKDVMKSIYPGTGKACVLGITGSPGAGKSTLAGEIARRFLDRGLSLGIIAVDPSSPYSGGALLGDRLRMRDISTNPGVFIRSMATRGALGGLCQAARDVMRIMDAAGKDVVLIETVGVGQDEIEVVSASDYVVLVTFPGQGDGIQATRAGVMEIADLFVVNKCDRDGADVMASEISAMLELSSEAGQERPPVMMTSAFTQEGIDDLCGVLSEFINRKKARGKPQRDHVRNEVLGLLEREMVGMLRERIMENGKLESALDAILEGKGDPYSAAEELMARVHLVRSRPGERKEDTRG